MTRLQKSVAFGLGMILLLVIILWLLMPWNAWAAGNHSHIISAPDSILGVFQVDSVHVEVYNDNGTADSTWVTAVTPGTDLVDTIPLDSTETYSVYVYIAYAGFTGYELYSAQHITPITVAAEASINYATIKANVADTLKLAHGAGSWVGIGSGGTGSSTIDVVVLDTLAGGSVAVDDAIVSFRDWGLTATANVVTSNVSGVARIATNDDSLAVLVHAHWFVFPTAWDSMSWTAGEDHVDTILGYSTPSSLNACVVSGYLGDASGDATYQYRLVTFSLPGIVTDSCNNVSIIDLSTSAITSSTGYFEVELLQSACIGDAKYTMTVEGLSSTKKITVPTETTYDIVWDE